ncbi:CDP-diacylglycerol--serine O-phosphatidyltransferase [Chrysiogenes arsenatis]|uniref:CDP-diacylglycerol--serine O-phosphatidyltransferase n=1 Tax=Chrysiogenes arsenatis TaxID=309797 RepID=UPI00042747EC|nr:CDP-diacylglycerol--serine O-phosphatidyltransferase [Chrysiogenes arsenatis]
MHKGIYIIPNMITLGGLFFGFYSIIASVRGDFSVAAFAILAAAICDMLDGKIARLIKADSKFGMELDSLVDLVAFGVAPAILIYMWDLQQYGRVGWMAAFLYVACGALRLARFNIQSSGLSRYFNGLPIPAAAGIVCSYVIFQEHYFLDYSSPILVAALGYTLAFLMVSNVKYYSFKDMSIFRRKPFNILVMVLLVFVLVGSYPELMIFVLAAAYGLSGIVGLIFQVGTHHPVTKHEENEYEQKNTRL